ncbi:MAG TPA: sugar phosphate isomerase/epimerase [Gemmataceae bacterium]|jgi:sugar phosphate isomerase/epimerase|nr:sugar phosphate isomerase/epimerase [Gemmataceae bacterium]
MQLGFVSAILGDLSLEEVVAFAAEEGFGCVEIMCWPPGKADRRYAGVCHLDVTDFSEKQADAVRKLSQLRGVAISGLGYYPNPLDGDAGHRKMVVEHLKKVISAAPKLGVNVVNTFIGRDHRRNVEENLALMKEVWPSIVKHAEVCSVRIGLENCPMLFSADEWPGGKNLPISPSLWRRIFAELRSSNIGLNIDPSHLIWQQIDAARCIREFGKQIVHVHAKDERIEQDKLYEHGILGLEWHTAKLPGLGDVNWPAFFSALSDTGYNGPVCIEVEDRAYEGSLEDRKRALRQSKRYLEQFMA